MIRRPPKSPLFPYTTPFRSWFTASSINSVRVSSITKYIPPLGARQYEYGRPLMVARSCARLIAAPRMLTCTLAGLRKRLRMFTWPPAWQCTSPWSRLGGKVPASRSGSTPAASPGLRTRPRSAWRRHPPNPGLRSARGRRSSRPASEHPAKLEVEGQHHQPVAVLAVRAVHHELGGDRVTGPVEPDHHVDHSFQVH